MIQKWDLRAPMKKSELTENPLPYKNSYSFHMVVNRNKDEKKRWKPAFLESFFRFPYSKLDNDIKCLGGGIGRRKGLKIPWGLSPYEFDSRPRHQCLQADERVASAPLM